METKDAWGGEQWNLIDLVHELLHVFALGDRVVSLGAREVELLILVEDEIAHELVQIRVQNASIPIVRDSTTVHSLANQVAKRLPWQILFVGLGRLVQVELNQTPRDAEVRIVEVVGDVPADLAVLFTLLNRRVEETQHVNEWFEFFPRAIVQNLVSQLAEVLLDVRTKTIWGLSNDL